MYYVRSGLGKQANIHLYILVGGAENLPLKYSRAKWMSFSTSFKPSINTNWLNLTCDICLVRFLVVVRLFLSSFYCFFCRVHLLIRFSDRHRERVRKRIKNHCSVREILANWQIQMANVKRTKKYPHNKHTRPQQIKRKNKSWWIIYCVLLSNTKYVGYKIRDAQIKRNISGTKRSTATTTTTITKWALNNEWKWKWSGAHSSV